MAKLNKNGYSLQYCIENSDQIYNGKKVYQLLHGAGIDNWNDLVNMYQHGYLPNPQIKGIGEKTWPVIIRMAEKEEWYRKPFGRKALEEEIEGLAVGMLPNKRRNTVCKIINILRRNDIFTLEQLYGAPEEYIRGIRNFGPVLLSLVNTIRQNERGSHKEHCEAFMKNYQYSYFFKAEIYDSARKAGLV